jgi:hypothetical protein
MSKSAVKPKNAEETQRAEVDHEQVLDWDFTLENRPTPERSGTIEVILNKVTISSSVLDEE